VNQTTMAALSMVIIDAIIGGFEDIGWEVLSSMRKAEFGQSVLSGLVIALMAILIDRITLGFAQRRAAGPGQRTSPLDGWRLLWFLAAALVAALLLRLLAPEGGSPLPDASGMMAISVLNEKLLAFVAANADWLEGIKNAVLYCLMLPLRLGISGAATPAIWGFTLPPLGILAYAAATAALAAAAAMRTGWGLAVSVLIASLLLFYGFVGFPWPALIAIVGVAAYSSGGWRISAFAGGGLGFILVTGLWLPLMQSIYLTALSVLLCLVIGGALGVWAANDDRISRVLRPINDALQTMPQFVFLIPALMFFKVGEFTALIAIMLYAIVPPIRYVEHGLRNVRPDVVEAARQMGATPGQLLWMVKLPLALPVVMLGLNQTIMAALSMLVIAAMVGTRDLGQMVYVALGKADAGLGLVSGLSIALVAMIADRIIQARFGATS
jgi:glycine betaine/proline transport system permease protein